MNSFFFFVSFDLKLSFVPISVEAGAYLEKPKTGHA
jgi:hypothetical protein